MTTANGLRRLVATASWRRLVGVPFMLCILAACTVRAPSVSRVTSPDARGVVTTGRGGIYYSLPRTVIRVRIPIEMDVTALTDLGREVLAEEIASTDLLAAAAGVFGGATPGNNARRTYLEQVATAQEAQRTAVFPAVPGLKEALKNESDAALNLAAASVAGVATSRAQFDVARNKVQDLLDREMKQRGKQLKEARQGIPRGDVKKLAQAVKDGNDAEVTLEGLDRAQAAILGLKADDGQAIKQMLEDDSSWSLANLGVDLAKVEEGKEFSVAEGVSIDTLPEADPAQVFFVELDGGALQEQSVKLAFSELGLLMSAGSATTDTTSEVVKETIGAVAKIAGGVIGLSTAGVKAPATPPAANPASPPPTGIPDRALELAQELKKLRVARTELITAAKGLTYVDKGTYESVLAKLDARVSEILKEFVVEKTSSWACVCEVRPEGGGGTCDRQAWIFQFPLLLVSKSDGVEAAASGSPRGLKDVVVEPRFRPSEGLTPLTADLLSLRLEVDRHQFSSQVRRSSPESAPERRSVYYRVPSVGAARVVRMPAGGAKAEDELAWQRVPVAQLGAVASLPGMVSGSGFEYTSEFYEAVGALKAVELKKEATKAADVIAAAGGAAGDILKAEADLKAAKVAARAAPPSENDKLETYKSKLQLELDIMDLEEKIAARKHQGDAANSNSK